MRASRKVSPLLHGVKNCCFDMRKLLNAPEYIRASIDFRFTVPDILSMKS